MSYLITVSGAKDGTPQAIEDVTAPVVDDFSPVKTHFAGRCLKKPSIQLVSSGRPRQRAPSPSANSIVPEAPFSGAGYVVGKLPAPKLFLSAATTANLDPPAAVNEVAACGVDVFDSVMAHVDRQASREAGW